MAISETLRMPITGDELLKMGDIGRCELVNGEIALMSPAGWRHGSIANRIATFLTVHVLKEKCGDVSAAETGFYIRHNPDTIRAPDAMYVSNERLAQIENPVKYLDVAPDLALEVLSPDDTWTQVETKVDEYLKAGVRIIWVVDPEQEAIAVYHPDGTRVRLSKSDILTGSDVLPDFSVPVAEIFDL